MNNNHACVTYIYPDNTVPSGRSCCNAVTVPHAGFSGRFRTALKVIGIISKLLITGAWTACMLSGGTIGFAAILGGIVFFGISAIIG